MQLLYGNDGNNYRTLAKTSDMDEHVEKALKDSYLFYQYVENEIHYSKTEKQPEAITYVTTDLGGILKKEHILLVKNGRMSNFSTPSSYAHFILQEADRKRYGEPFLSMMQSSFISDKDSLLCDREMLERYQPRIRERGDGGEFPEDVLKVIAGYIMLRDKSSAKVKVIMDAAGDSYNERTMALLLAVYRYLPYDLRKKHGFLSYTGTQQNVPGRVKLELYNPESIKRVTDDFIDLNSMKAGPLFNQLPLEYREYLDYIASLTEEQRDSHYKSISVGSVYLTAADYIDIYRSLVRWSKEPIDTIFPEWVEFALSESRKQSPGYHVFQGIVKKRLDSPAYNKKLSHCLENQGQGGIDKWNSVLKDLIKFGEEIKTLEFFPEPFIEWLCSHSIPYFCKQYADFFLVDQLEEETKKVLEYKCGDGFRKILNHLAVTITMVKEQKIQEINKKIELEKESITRILCPERIQTIPQLEEAGERLERELNYPKEIKSELEQAWTASFAGLLNQVEQFYQAADYEVFQEALKKAPEYISVSSYEKLETLLSAKHQWIEAVERSREIRLLTELAGRRYLYKVGELKKLLDQKNIRLQDCSIVCVLGTEKIEMSYENLRSLCDFIEYPHDLDEYVMNFFSEKEERLILLLQNDYFYKEHFSYLLRFCDETVCAVVWYYCHRFHFHDTELSRAAKILIERVDGKRERKEFIGMLKEQPEINQNLNDLIRLLEGKKIVCAENTLRNETGMWIVTITAVLAFSLVFLVNTLILTDRMQQIYITILYALDFMFLVSSIVFAWFFDE